MRGTLIWGIFTFYLVTTATSRTVRDGIKRNAENQATLKNYRNQFATIHEALSGSVESVESTNANNGPSYRIDLGEALEAESFRAAAVSSDSLEYSHEGRNPEEGEVETTTLFPVQSLIGSNQWLKSDLDEDDAEEDEEALDDGCDEGDVMRVSCNSCVCINSQYVCSKKDCMEPEIPLPPKKTGGSSKKKGTLNYNKKVDPIAVPVDDTGSVLYGEYFSSEADLVSGIGNENETIPREDDLSSEMSCIDGRIKPVDCNHCICATGRWACTKQSCIANSLREKASFHGADFIKKADTLKENMGIDEDCMEGDTKKADCNRCVCHEQSWACTDYECPSASPPVKPSVNAVKLEPCQTEEDVKSVECNICSCRSGIWRCTSNDCKKFGDKYYQPIQRAPLKTDPLLLDSDSAENHSFL